MESVTVAPMNAEDFFQRHGLGVYLFQRTYDPRGVESSINPDAFMRVISNDSKFTVLAHSRWISNFSLPFCLRDANEKP
jgi:hypothetical protein